ncbi:unnamed protein product [Calicophoron daubneyi]|uniref:Uncharacterized protein n=1 Tax=Calicophoron daubneyi TaxID=300641 RepID=A0AAV2T6R7_CALDB
MAALPFGYAKDKFQTPTGQYAFSKPGLSGNGGVKLLVLCKQIDLAVLAAEVAQLIHEYLGDFMERPGVTCIGVHANPHPGELKGRAETIWARKVFGMVVDEMSKKFDDRGQWIRHQERFGTGPRR